MQSKTYDKYPSRTILISNTVALTISVIGAIIMFQIGRIRFVLYIIYILFLEFRLLQGSCRYCYYYGKYCAFGKGKLCAVFFRKGDPKKFIQRKILRKDLIPEALVAVIPIIIGIVLIIIAFNRRILIGIIMILALTTQGNNCVR